MSNRKLHEAYKYNMYLPFENGARFATEAEIKNSLSKINIMDSSYNHGGIPMISDGQVAYVDDKDTHTLIFGSTGSKKSRLFCMPLINILANSGKSFIVTDPKGELYEKTSGLAKENGYNVIVLNFREPELGDGWNPLELPYKLYKNGQVDKAVEMINDFIGALSGQVENAKDPFWTHAASGLGIALILILFDYAKENEINFRSIAKMLPLLGDTNSPLYSFIKRENISELISMNLEGIMKGAENTRRSIMSVFLGMIRMFVSQTALMDMTSKCTFDLSRIGFEKTAIYIIMPDEKTTFHFLISTFIKQCYEILISEAQSKGHEVQGLSKHALPITVHFVLDEFANIPCISDMPSMITAARSRNIRFTLFVQSEHQLKKIYMDEAQTIKSNCNNWIFLTSREYDLLRELSDLSGMIDDKRNLISVSELQRLSKEKGEALLFHGREYPYITTLADIDDYCFEKYPPIGIKKRKGYKAGVFSIIEYMLEKY
jgi:type IV secretory pathway TraG/TraD family ATPase VirD4